MPRAHSLRSGRAFASVALVAGLATGTASCATTIVDSQGSTIPEGATAPPATTNVADAPAPTNAADQIAAMVSAARTLGDEIADGKPEPIARRITELWESARPDVRKVDPAAEREIDHQLEIIATAVARKRPADADKASNNLAIVAESLAGKW